MTKPPTLNNSSPMSKSFLLPQKVYGPHAFEGKAAWATPLGGSLPNAGYHSPDPSRRARREKVQLPLGKVIRWLPLLVFLPAKGEHIPSEIDSLQRTSRGKAGNIIFPQLFRSFQLVLLRPFGATGFDPTDGPPGLRSLCLGRWKDGSDRHEPWPPISLAF